MYVFSRSVKKTNNLDVLRQLFHQSNCFLQSKWLRGDPHLNAVTSQVWRSDDRGDLMLKGISRDGRWCSPDLPFMTAVRQQIHLCDYSQPADFAPRWSICAACHPTHVFFSAFKQIYSYLEAGVDMKVFWHLASSGNSLMDESVPFFLENVIGFTQSSVTILDILESKKLMVNLKRKKGGFPAF